MKREYDFRRGKRGRILPPEHEPAGKVRITIRIDEDIIDHFLKEADASGGAVGYQTLINDALRQHVDNKAPKLEDTLRRIFREEIRAAS
jgi:uncharacterized protein (DUF4415 family)